MEIRKMYLSVYSNGTTAEISRIFDAQENLLPSPSNVSMGGMLETYMFGRANIYVRSRQAFEFLRHGQPYVPKIRRR
jgi:hypothetical protein